MISVIDFGISNIGSITNALNYLKIKNKTIASYKEIVKAKKIIIPGNGNFGRGIELIKKKKFFDTLNERIKIKKIPVLGICLGYHLMLNESEESPTSKGFGWINGKAIKFKTKKNFVVPHVGWNEIQSNNSTLLNNIPNNSMFYFDHSYFPKIYDNSFSNCITNYSVNFTSIFEKENIFGCQPHPEKSQKFGLRLLENFSKV